VDEDLAGAGFGHVEFDDLGGDLAWRVVDDGLVFLREVGHGGSR